MTSPFDAVRRLSAASVNLLLSRAEFASIELAQARAQLMRWLLLALAVLLLGLLGLMCATAAVAIALWPQVGWVALLLPAAVYLIAGAAVFRTLTREMDEAQPLLSDTLAELRKDRDAFRGRGAESSPDISAASAADGDDAARPQGSP